MTPNIQLGRQSHEPGGWGKAHSSRPLGPPPPCSFHARCPGSFPRARARKEIT